MVTTADRLVERIHRRWQCRTARTAGRLLADEVAELTARVRQLQSMDARYTHVDLAHDVARVDATGMRDRVGGECVTTEV